MRNIKEKKEWWKKRKEEEKEKEERERQTRGNIRNDRQRKNMKNRKKKKGELEDNDRSNKEIEKVRCLVFSCPYVYNRPLSLASPSSIIFIVSII